MHSGQHQLDALTATTQMALMGATTQYSDDRPDYDDLLNALILILLFAHGQAAMIGRQQAGDMTPLTAGDQAFAEGVMAEEMPYLLGIIDDLKAGQYTRSTANAASGPKKATEAAQESAQGVTGTSLPAEVSGVVDEAPGVPNVAAITRRAALYAGRLTGTANDAWVASLPAGTQIDWVLGGVEDHC